MEIHQKAWTLFDVHKRLSFWTVFILIYIILFNL